MQNRFISEIKPVFDEKFGESMETLVANIILSRIKNGGRYINLMYQDGEDSQLTIVDDGVDDDFLNHSYNSTLDEAYEERVNYMSNIIKVSLLLKCRKVIIAVKNDKGVFAQKYMVDHLSEYGDNAIQNCNRYEVDEIKYISKLKEQKKGMLVFFENFNTHEFNSNDKLITERITKLHELIRNGELGYTLEELDKHRIRIFSNGKTLNSTIFNIEDNSESLSIEENNNITTSDNYDRSINKTSSLSTHITENNNIESEKYIVRTEYKNFFTNIKPICKITLDGLLELDGYDFGQYGVMQVTSIHNATSDLLDENVYSVLEIPRDVMDGLLVKDDGTRLIKVDDFNKYAHAIDEYTEISEVIEINRGLDFSDIDLWDEVVDIYKPITKRVHIKKFDQVAGPFTWVKNEYGYKFTPANISGRDSYLINLYDLEDLMDEPDIFDFDEDIRQIQINGYGRARKFIYGTEDTLPDPIIKVDCMSNKEMKTYIGRMISNSLENTKDKNEIVNFIDSLSEYDLSEQRKDKIIEFLRINHNMDDFINTIPDIIFQSEQNTEKLIDIIFSNENYISDKKLSKYIENLTGYEDKQEEILKFKEQKKSIENEIAILQKQIVEYQNHSNDIVSSAKVKELEEEKIILERDNNQLKEAVRKFGDLEELKRNEEQIRSALDVRRSDLERIADDASQKINDAYRNLFDQQFDGEISNMIMENASVFQRERNKKKMQNWSDCLNNEILFSNIDNMNDLIDFLFVELTESANRSITKNDVVNILLCLCQGFITIFAGEPGTGKSSLVNHIANMMGLKNEGYLRYVEVPVEKGWTSRRDFIGYYNPINKNFETANRQLFDALNLLDYESKSMSDKDVPPYLVLLDEANLSQMEYYWADFMGLCDLDKTNRVITLSDDMRIDIPQHLKFMATINLDHTTEGLSPRLVDRAWVCLMEPKKISIQYIGEETIYKSYPPINMNVLSPFMKPLSNKLDEAIVDKFMNIYDCFYDMNIHFSPRIMGMIKRYCLCGKGYFEGANTYVGLDYAIAQKVLPKINGYGDEYKQFVEKLIKICDENSLPKSNKILKNILKTGDLNMQYYHFFAR